LFSLLSKEQIAQLLSEWELDFSYALPGYARFRGNIIIQRGTLAAVFRVVPFRVPEMKDLGLPADVQRLCALNRGLVLVTGPTGSGKSTTMAAMIDHMNQTRAINIITIEDPIEFLHTHGLATVRQREVGTDTHSFARALRQALRHDPDVIMVGEMRDAESISIALTAAETGHLVLSTLHTQTAPLSISRIIDSYPAEQKQQVRQQLSGALRAVISQQLVEDTSGQRVAAIEYMVDTSAVTNLIREGKEHQLYSALQTGREVGMQTMDQALVALMRTGRITREKMMQYCIDEKEIVRLARVGGN
ncbi:MAG: PilT/PilU family type 4a pilus ATPase, partial [Pygmaiobacter sp.]